MKNCGVPLDRCMVCIQKLELIEHPCDFVLSIPLWTLSAGTVIRYHVCSKCWGVDGSGCRGKAEENIVMMLEITGVAPDVSKLSADAKEHLMRVDRNIRDTEQMMLDGDGMGTEEILEALRDRKVKILAEDAIGELDTVDRLELAIRRGDSLIITDLLDLLRQEMRLLSAHARTGEGHSARDLPGEA